MQEIIKEIKIEINKLASREYKTSLNIHLETKQIQLINKFLNEVQTNNKIDDVDNLNRIITDYCPPESRIAILADSLYDYIRE